MPYRWASDLHIEAGMVNGLTLEGECDIEGRRPQAHRELLRVQGFTGHQQDMHDAQAGLLQAGDEDGGRCHVLDQVLRLAHVAIHDCLHSRQGRQIDCSAG